MDIESLRVPNHCSLARNIPFTILSPRQTISTLVPSTVLLAWYLLRILPNMASAKPLELSVWQVSRWWWSLVCLHSYPTWFHAQIIYIGDHPKTAEAIARKINLILGDTRQTFAAKTGRHIDGIYEDEVSAIVVHGDEIDELQGWQWDQSKIFVTVCRLWVC